MKLRPPEIENASQAPFLMYPGKNGEDGTRLRAAVRRVIPELWLEAFTNLDALTARLRFQSASEAVIILLASDRDELEEMYARRDLLKEFHILLVIPDREESTISLAHRMLPRFLSPKDGDFSDIEKVLAKMVLALRHGGGTTDSPAMTQDR